MRQIRPFVIGFVSCVLAFAAVRASAQQTTEGIVKVVAISGDARYFLAGDSTPHILKAGMTLKQGTVIQTASGTGNYVDLIVNNAQAVSPPSGSPSEVAHYQPKAEQDGIRIFDNSVLSIDKLTLTATGADTVTDTELDLKAGSILGTVKKLTPTSKYEVKIPNGVAGIRGTIYWLSANGILKVLVGPVVIAYVGPDGNVVTQTVNSGQQFDTNTGLITPISITDLSELTRDSFDFRLFHNSPTTFIAPDHRIYYVSPVQGGNGQGQNQGGNGGGNGP
jgi:hypothetical protein